jgi:adenosylcobinamide amidohydrolase
MAVPERHSRTEDGLDLPFLVWRLPSPLRMVSSALLGGGIGLRSWVLNAQVAHGYDRLDPIDHLLELAARVGLSGDGVGLLTAADVDAQVASTDDDVRLVATVGVRVPTWAAAPVGVDDEVFPHRQAYAPGTINIVAFMPRPLTDGALVNLVATATEAKTQALLDLGVPGTGTATDAVCVACPPVEAGAGDADDEGDGEGDGEAALELFGGPRSVTGSALARAVHEAVTIGTAAGLARPGPDES